MTKNGSIKISFAAITAMTIVTAAAAETTNLELLKRVEALETLIKQHKIDTSEQIEELHARSDENEFQSSLNRIKWGGSLEATAGTYDGVMGSVKGMSNGRDFHSENKWSTKLKTTTKMEL